MTQVDLEQIASALFDSLVVYDGHGRLAHSNKALADLLDGRPPESGADLTDLFGDDAAKLRAEQVPVVPLRMSLNHPAGASVPVEVAVRELADGMRAAVVRDLRLEQEHTRMKANFLSALSYELRDPLTGISGSLQLVNEAVGPRLEPGEQQLIEVALRSCRRLSDFLTDLVELDRLDRGKAELELAFTDLGSVLRAALDEAASDAEAREVRLTPDIPGQSAGMLADASRFRRAIGTLLDYCIASATKGGEVKAGVSQTDDELVVEMRDDGAPLTEEQGRLLFERFAPPITWAGGRPQPRGLDLAIVKAVVEQHAGRLEVDSSESGTGFRLRFKKLGI